MEESGEKISPEEASVDVNDVIDRLLQIIASQVLQIVKLEAALKRESKGKTE